MKLLAHVLEHAHDVGLGLSTDLALLLDGVVHLVDVSEELLDESSSSASRCSCSAWSLSWRRSMASLKPDMVFLAFSWGISSCTMRAFSSRVSEKTVSSSMRPLRSSRR